MRERLERILGELERRYGLDAAFSMRVRPVAARIFDPQTPEDVRPALLTHLAETYERQASLQESRRQALAGIRSMFDNLARLLQQAYGMPQTGLPGRLGEEMPPRDGEIPEPPRESDPPSP